MSEYRCKACKTIVPRGYRMQECECKKIAVDWGASGNSEIIRVLWPDGDSDDWVEVIE